MWFSLKSCLAATAASRGPTSPDRVQENPGRAGGRAKAEPSRSCNRFTSPATKGVRWPVKTVPRIDIRAFKRGYESIFGRHFGAKRDFLKGLQDGFLYIFTLKTRSSAAVLLKFNAERCTSLPLPLSTPPHPGSSAL